MGQCVNTKEHEWLWREASAFLLVWWQCPSEQRWPTDLAFSLTCDTSSPFFLRPPKDGLPWGTRGSAKNKRIDKTEKPKSQIQYLEQIKIITLSCDQMALLASPDLLHHLSIPQSQRTLLNVPQKRSSSPHRGHFINTQTGPDTTDSKSAHLDFCGLEQRIPSSTLNLISSTTL